MKRNFAHFLYCTIHTLCLLTVSFHLLAETSLEPDSPLTLASSNTVLPVIPLPSLNQPLSAQLQVTVKHIKLTGNQVFSDDELKPVIAPYEGRQISNDDLQALRRELTLYYVNQGYINSGASLPDQAFQNGELEVLITEGRLAEIQIIGNKRLRTPYLKQRLALQANEPLNVHQLQTRIQLLHQDPLIDHISAQLAPGSQRGQSLLRVNVKESRPYQFGVSMNNWRSPSVGELHSEIWGAHSNLLGYGDAIDLQYTTTKGYDGISLNYSLPMNHRDTRLQVSYSRSESKVVEKPFDVINIIGETESYGVRLSHPLLHDLNEQWIGSMEIERRHSENFLSGGAMEMENGISTVAALRLGQEWVKHRQNQVLAINATLNLGLDAFNATINEPVEPSDGSSIADGKFISWLGQFQWLQRFASHQTQLLFRSHLQLSNSRLLSMEKFSLGGANSVRGYRENLLIRDQGLFSSIEMRLTIPKSQGKWQVASFYDIGWGANVDGPSDAKTLSSLGAGLRWDPNRHWHTQLYWGHALNSVDLGLDNTLQEDGFHLSVDYRY